MRSITAKALAALPRPPYTVGTTSTDYCQGQEPRETRAIRDCRGVDVLYVVATSALELKEGDEFEEENNPARIHTANVLAAVWAKCPELIAALGDLLDGLQSGQQPAQHAIDYAERVLRETERAILEPQPAIRESNA